MQYLPPATKLGQGNIFRSVCQEFCSQEGSDPLHPGMHTPRDQRQAPPTPVGADPIPPGPEAGTPHPPGAVHDGRYGQQAGGTHPNGMQSCNVLSQFPDSLLVSSSESLQGCC